MGFLFMEQPNQQKLLSNFSAIVEKALDDERKRNAAHELKMDPELMAGPPVKPLLIIGGPAKPKKEKPPRADQPSSAVAPPRQSRVWSWGRGVRVVPVDPSKPLPTDV